MNLFSTLKRLHRRLRPWVKAQLNPCQGRMHDRTAANKRFISVSLLLLALYMIPSGPGSLRPYPYSAAGPDTSPPSPTNTPSAPPDQLQRSPAADPGVPSLTSMEPDPLGLPVERLIQGMTGKRQSMPLSCESRSAVDWAAYFGTQIDESAFFSGIPVSDNPEEGFVGSVYGSWGQTPPASYGVHAPPVAQRLREFGLNAKAVRGMTFQELKTEVASGQPVIVWVIGHVGLGSPTEYTAEDGEVVTVAKFEHTVIVIGYTEHEITVQDGGKVYSKYHKEFQKSWEVLGNQAVIWID